MPAAIPTEEEASPLPDLPPPTPAPVVVRSPRAPWSSAVIGFLRVMRANPLTLAGFVLVVIICVSAIVVAAVPPLTQLLLGHALAATPYDPNMPTAALHQGPSFAHWFGTDELGRDMFSLVLAALPLDLAIGLSVTGFALIVGSGLGLVAGFWDKPRTLGGAVSTVIMRVTDVFLAFPSLVLALAVAATLGRSIFTTVLAVMVTWWPYYVRLTRGEVLAVKNLPYVTAARASGVSEVRILFRHVLRNILEPLTIYYTLDVGTVLVTFSTLSFVGVTGSITTPEWGQQVEFYQGLLPFYPWTVLAPGLAIFVTCLAFSLLGDGLRDILDPRSRRALIQAAQPSTLPAEVPAVAARGGGGAGA
ncbi:MAG: ABC transporter permease [Thermoplasmata archaeon]|nr:ABC transporter permease [Thermoplasmata archaeon]